MNLKKVIAIATCAVLTVPMSSCTVELVSGNDKSTSSVYSDVSSEQNSDDVVWIGNDDVGWLAVDDGFYEFYDPDTTDTCIQYAESPYDILTLDVIENCDAKTAASIRLSLLQTESTSENIEEVTGARATVGDQYEAYQVYCYYPDDLQYLVMWYIDSPSENKCYYIAAEFLITNVDFIDYVETYKMPE